MAGEVILKTEIPREKGFLYWVGSDDKGNLAILKTKAGRKSKK